jgi:glucokinase
VNRRITLGVDIGGSHLSCALIDNSTLEIISGSDVRSTYDHTLDANSIFNIWANTITASLDSIPLHSEFQGIGFAMPGPFEYANGISKMEQKLVSLFGKHIPTELNRKLDFDHDIKMRFINDATSFAIGESLKGQGHLKKKVVVITLGTGFGSAFLENNLPIVDRSDVPEEGCLWHLPFKDGIADNYFSTSWFISYYKTLSDSPIQGVKDMLEVGSESDIKQVFNRFSENLSTFIGPHLKTFDAEILIIGGNISKSLPYFIDSLKAHLTNQNIEVEIAPSILLEEAALIGGAHLFDSDFWQEVSKVLPNL